MRDYLSLRGSTDTPPVFPRPSSVVTTRVNRDTGLPTSPDDPRAIDEWFLAGTEPTAGTPPATRP
jgi:hypothetical protein